MTWQALILDIAVIAALTTLALVHIIPPEAVLAMMGTFVGARVIQRSGGGGPPQGGSPLASSTALALTLGFMGFLSRNHNA